MFVKKPGHVQYFVDDVSGLVCRGWRGVRGGTDNILNNTAKMLWVSTENVVCMQTVLLVTVC